MKRILPLVLSLLLLLVGCGGNGADGSYQQITQEEAKEMMDTEDVSLPPKIELIQGAIEQHRTIRFAYFSPKEESVRTVEPYYLVFHWSAWYVWGWCQTREDFRGGYCPGCGGGAGNQSCAMAKCALEHGGVPFCWECPEYPCPRYEGFDDADSFVPHRNRKQDIALARELGLEAYVRLLGGAV